MKSLRLALIDDENDLAEMFSYYLADLGHEVVPFNSAKTALDALKKTEVDIIITDLKMPFLSGIHLIQELTKFHKRPLPAILLTVESDGEFSESEEKENLKKLGFLEIINKTNGLEKLAQTITDYSASTDSLMFA